jgi:hypothetical protein
MIKSRWTAGDANWLADMVMVHKIMHGHGDHCRYKSELLRVRKISQGFCIFNFDPETWEGKKVCSNCFINKITRLYLEHRPECVCEGRLLTGIQTGAGQQGLDLGHGHTGLLLGFPFSNLATIHYL